MRGFADEEDREESTSEEEEDETSVHGDALLFDVLKDALPDAKSGRSFVLLSLLLQTVMVVLLFLGHHHKRKDFDCCNMYAVLCAAIFLIIQVIYYFDWCTIYGDNPAWHRANLFAPATMYILVFLEWALGTLSMLARAIDLDLFAVQLGKMDGLEKASFYICTIAGGICVILLFIASYAHRNNLGHYYYTESESQTDLVLLTDSPVPVQGSFKFRRLLHLLARFLSVETSLKASRNLPRLIVLIAILQIPFYLFSSLTYRQGTQSIFPVFFICMGIVSLIVNGGYVFSAVAPRARYSRRWNRINLFSPMVSLYAIVACYFFTVASVLFKNEANSEQWEHIIPNLDATEKAYFSVNISLVVLLFLVQIVLTNLHRKGWCDGRKEVNIMLTAVNMDKQAVQRMANAARGEAETQKAKPASNDQKKRKQRVNKNDDADDEPGAQEEA